MGEVIPFPNSDINPLIYDENESKESIIDSENVLFGAMSHDLKEVIVIGRCEDGSLYLASNTNVLPKVTFLIDLAKNRILSGMVDGD